MPKKKTNPISVTSLKHSDKRANIPTEELRDFVKEDEKTPKTLLYPRDPSLDPQLVWKGKDEQDRELLEVPSVPVYIQEKISPQAIIENVRANSAKSGNGHGISETQMQLFADFNHIPFDVLVDFYQHEQAWTNRMILGDSLLVMASLAEKENLKGRVQMIYLDPPYGIKFGSNWQTSTRKQDVKDNKEEDITMQPEQIKAFRDTWQLGIHSYLAYIRDRLTIAHELLTESGSIFIQISDENVHLLRCILDEVFGSENFIRHIVYRTSAPLTSKFIPGIFDHILWYSKNVNEVKFRRAYSSKTLQDDKYFDTLEFGNGEYRKLTRSEQSGDEQSFPINRVFANITLVAAGPNPNCVFPIEFQGKLWNPTSGRGWKTNKEGIKRVKFADRLYSTSEVLRYKFFLNDFPLKELTNLWTDFAGASDKVYVVQTNTDVIQRCMLMTTDPGDLVLDPTCGSGTTAFVAEQWGRRWITIDTSRVAIALARTRLMAARYPYYTLADSADGILKDAEVSGQLPPQPIPVTMNDIKHGFVYKRVSHIMLKSIANNEEIDVIYEKYQQEMEPQRAELNKLMGTKWEEWDITRELKEGKGKAVEIHQKWWELRRERQKEIDASIAQRADVELLYDQPYEDKKKVRVSGPFTVESLSPHRVLPSEQERPQSEQEADNQPGAAQFETLIVENLRVSGVQATKKGEKLKFSYLEPFASPYLQAVGEYEGKDGKAKRVAVCIGPEHGTVGADLVKEAAKEAVKGQGFDLLVVLGFAFDPHVSEEAKEWGSITILPARINPELQMHGNLLKKTGAANLFMAFGEPDMEVTKTKEGKLTVTIKGVDVYDPNTGEIRSSSTDEIACWFIDTAYNGESFFVRHAYFTGGNDPYDKLKRALRADIDEVAWSALYTNVSMPFEVSPTGKIAVKVINHYGDEVMKVVEVK